MDAAGMQQQYQAKAGALPHFMDERLLSLWLIWEQTDADRAAIAEVFSGAPGIPEECTRRERASVPVLNVISLADYRARKVA